MLEEELSMLGEGPVFREELLPLGEGLAAPEKCNYLKAHHKCAQCTFFNIC